MALAVYLKNGLNYETSAYKPVFYRLVGDSVDPRVLSLSDGDANYDDESYLQSLGLSACYTINHNTTLFFNRNIDIDASSPMLCSIKAYLYDVASSDPTPTILADIETTGSAELSVAFVNSFPEARFVAYPTYKIKNNGTLVYPTPANYSTEVDALSFFGEGHTEYVWLSVGPTDSTLSASWSIYDTETFEELSFTSDGIRELTALATVPTEIGSYPSYEISLQLYNNTFLLDGPTRKEGGFGAYYPFVSAAPTNVAVPTIDVKPYPAIEFTGSAVSELSSPPILILPFNWSSQFFAASASVTQTTTSSIVSLTSTEVGTDNQVLSGEYGWMLSSVTDSWSTVTDTPSTAAFEFFLRYAETQGVPYTCYYEVSSLIVQSLTFNSQQIINKGPKDWLPKIVSTEIATLTAAVAARPKLALYTQTPVVELSSVAKFENLNTFVTGLCGLSATFEDGNPTTLNILSADKFEIIFTDIGHKTVTLDALIYGSPVQVELKDLVNVVSYYDELSATSYFNADETAFTLPYPNKPSIAPNEFGTHKVINKVADSFQQNLSYLLSRVKIYDPRGTEYHGWLGEDVQTAEPGSLTELLYPYTWQDLECPGENYILWQDVDCTSLTAVPTNYVWSFHECTGYDPYCFQKYCIGWKWKLRKSNASDRVLTTWKSTKSTEIYAKKWAYEPCALNPVSSNCGSGYWHVNQPLLTYNWNPIPYCAGRERCKYTGIGTIRGGSYIAVARPTEVQLFADSYSSTSKVPIFVASTNFIDELTLFANIGCLATDSANKIFVLDTLLNKIGVLEYIDQGNLLRFANSWGSFGGRSSQSGFNKPTHIHIDQFNRVWVTDSGNKCVKVYSSGGSWIKTIYNAEFENHNLVACAVDAEGIAHIMSTTSVFRVGGDGNILSTYETTLAENPFIGIDTNFTRTCVYIQQTNKIAKFFHNGEKAYSVSENMECVDGNLVSFNGRMSHDRKRNLYALSNDKILKFVDRMVLLNLGGNIGNNFWDETETRIDKNEAVTDWPLTRMFHRLWDNIEIVRGVLRYENSGQKQYRPASYSKDKLTIGHNEIVSSAVVNRSIDYLWENFQSLVKYFET